MRGFAVFGLALFMATVGAWLMRHAVVERAEQNERARMMRDVVETVAGVYVDSLTEADLYDLAIDGMLRGLGDPYTDLLRADDLADLRITTRGDYVGIGIRVEVHEGLLTVVTPLSGSPADEAGIESGDRIVEVDGVSVLGWNTSRLSTALRGDSGTSVTVGVRRPGVREVLPFSVRRELVHVASVRYSDLAAPGVGYVQLETVSAESASEVATAVEALAARGARGLILDLRFNPGGLLQEGIAVSDLFLDRGRTVVETRGRGPRATRSYRARSAQRWSDMPLVVLVNEFSASAAEVIAGALQDHDRAIILGTSTFGKGLVQSVLRVSDDEALRLTTSRWFTPSGRSIHRYSGEETQSDSTTFRTASGRIVHGGGGIQPDVEVPAEGESPQERRLLRELGGDVPAYRDAVAALALDLKGEGSLTEAGAFRASPELRARLRARLRERGVSVSDGAWTGAGAVIDRDVERMVRRYVFGREVEMQFVLRGDPVVQRAAALLEEADSPAALLAAVSAAR